VPGGQSGLVIGCPCQKTATQHPKVLGRAPGADTLAVHHHLLAEPPQAHLHYSTLLGTRVPNLGIGHVSAQGGHDDAEIFTPDLRRKCPFGIDSARGVGYDVGRVEGQRREAHDGASRVRDGG